jgi:hypothetical protein
MPIPIRDEKMAALRFAAARQSCVRRGWPLEVVEALFAAEVICRAGQKQTEPPPDERVTQRLSVNQPARFGVLMYD